MNKHQRGLTLIELMMVITLLAILIVAAAPLSGLWVREADITGAGGELTQAVGHAKAAALRNRIGATANNPVSAICITNNTLTVRQGSGNTAVNCTAPGAGDTLWSTQLDTDVTIESASVAVSCVCFDNKGYFTTQGNCGGCLMTDAVQVTANGVDDLNIFLQ